MAVSAEVLLREWMQTKAVKEEVFVLEQNGISAGVSEGSLGVIPQNKRGEGGVYEVFIPCQI